MTPLRLKTYPTSIRFPLELRDRIHAAAAAEWIREAVRAALAKAEAKTESAAVTAPQD